MFPKKKSVLPVFKMSVRPSSQPILIFSWKLIVNIRFNSRIGNVGLIEVDIWVKT